MNQLDVYYRALLEYRKYTTARRDCSALRSAIAEANPEGDQIVIRRAVCTIDEDWVEEIERGLVHVEKALKEERQFIRSNGEVIPIEKVKSVSRESVEHLAKHSSLISRFEEGEDIVPDKLYTVERLSDYAVYENRFLYMLLCYLRDFVTLRHNKILDLTNKYDGRLQMTKSIACGKQRMKYTVTLHDERRDDPYLSEHNPCRTLIDRISLILKTILSFLATPLMEAVAKVPMIKPPITKTNVLKMNHNFKGAVALYDFILAYDKDGYTVNTQIDTLSPFAQETADELAEAGALLSFLTYEYGLDMRAELKEAYRLEEERLAKERIRERADRIKALERRLRAAEIPIEDYVLELEKQVRALESEAERADRLDRELAEAKKTIAEQARALEERDQAIARLKDTIEAMKREHFEELRALKKEHAAALTAMLEKQEELRRFHEQQLERLAAEHEAALAAQAAEHAQVIAALRTAHEEERQALILEHETVCAQRQAAHDAQLAALEEQIGALRETAAAEKDTLTRALTDKDAVLAEQRARYETLETAARLSEARIKALGGITEDYTSRERFDELEREYEAFTRLYKQQWALTKKRIRKDILNLKKLKGQAEETPSDD